MSHLHNKCKYVVDVPSNLCKLVLLSLRAKIMPQWNDSFVIEQFMISSIIPILNYTWYIATFAYFFLSVIGLFSQYDVCMLCLWFLLPIVVLRPNKANCLAYWLDTDKLEKNAKRKRWKLSCPYRTHTRFRFMVYHGTRASEHQYNGMESILRDLGLNYKLSCYMEITFPSLHSKFEQTTSSDVEDCHHIGTVRILWTHAESYKFWGWLLIYYSYLIIFSGLVMSMCKICSLQEESWVVCYLIHFNNCLYKLNL